jgi:PRTRC genetic system protein A
MRPIVGYTVFTKGDVPLGTDGIAYTYRLAADGVCVTAENACLQATIPVATGAIRGIRASHSGVELPHGRVPHALWQAILAVCQAAANEQQEVLCEVIWLPEQRYALRQPRQLAGVSALAYERQDRALLQLHSHHRMPAFFSATDDQDEQGLGLYGVLVRLGVAGQQPEVLLRVGVYGHYQTLPWAAVFAGDLRGVRDLSQPPAENRGDEHGHSGLLDAPREERAPR